MVDDEPIEIIKRLYYNFKRNMDLHCKFKEYLKKIQTIIYNTPIDWRIVGTSDTNEILELYKKAYLIGIENGKIKNRLDYIEQYLK